MKRKVIAVTGGIGSGKSQVLAILRSQGFATVDCDALSRQIADEKQVIAAVEQLLGSDCVTNGAINRQKVREVVFSDRNLLAKYNAIFHERVKNRLNEQIQRANGIVFVEIAVLDAFEFHFDEIWLVASEQQTRIERVTARDGVTVQNVEHIMKRQYYADYTRTISNDGSVDELCKQVFLALKEAQIV